MLEHQCVMSPRGAANMKCCSASQRTYIALLEKKLTFNYHEVSLRNPQTGLWYPLTEKPKWFTDLNPLGKVSPGCAY